MHSRSKAYSQPSYPAKIACPTPSIFATAGAPIEQPLPRMFGLGVLSDQISWPGRLVERQKSRGFRCGDVHVGLVHIVAGVEQQEIARNDRRDAGRIERRTPSVLNMSYVQTTSARWSEHCPKGLPALTLPARHRLRCRDARSGRGTRSRNGWSRTRRDLLRSPASSRSRSRASHAAAPAPSWGWSIATETLRSVHRNIAGRPDRSKLGTAGRARWRCWSRSILCLRHDRRAEREVPDRL